MLSSLHYPACDRELHERKNRRVYCNMLILKLIALVPSPMSPVQNFRFTFNFYGVIVDVLYSCKSLDVHIM